MKLLVVEDHALVREAMGAALRRLGGCVEVVEARDAEGALRRLEADAEIEFVLLDLLLPGMDGFAFLGLLRQRFPLLPVLVVSALGDAVTVGRVARLGASGFVHKSFGGDELLDSVSTVLEGGLSFPDPDAAPVSGAPGRAVRHKDVARDAGLTAAQTRVLELLSQGKSNREIAALLGLTEGTVKIHLSAIYRALKVGSRAQALVVLRRGRP